MAILIDSYPDSNQNSEIGWGGLAAGHGQGQSFLGDGSILDSAQFLLRKTTASAGQIAAAVYAVGSGTHGTNAIPTSSGLGTPLAISNVIDATSLPGSLTLETFTFSGANRITLANGTPYIVAIAVTSSLTGQIAMGMDDSSPTHSGNASRSSSLSGTWGSVSYEFIFYVYGETPVATETFGKTTNGASNTLHNSGRLTLSQAVLTENAFLKKGWFRTRTNNTTETKHFKTVIYADSSGEPGALLHVSDETSFLSTTVNWLSTNFADESLPAGTYWIGAIYDGTGVTAVHPYRDNTAAMARSRTNTYASGAPNPAGTVSNLNGPVDFYIEYEPDLGAPEAPDAPSDLVATAITDERIDLTWTDNASGAAQEDNFVLERKEGSGGTYAQIATPAQDADSYSDIGLDPETTYYYRIKAVNTEGDSAWSDEANATTLEEGFTPRWLATSQAWVYPGFPAQNADEEYSDGRVIHSLKPEYIRVQTDGTLLQLNDTGTDPTNEENAYSVSNAADVIAHSTEQWITVASDGANMHALTSNPTNYADAIDTLVNFCVDIGFTGVELDWEGYGSWTSTSYGNYKLFVEDLADALHLVGKKLMILGPPIGNSTEQGYYEWQYEDFDTSAVDYIGVMAYDYQWDYGGGTAVAPNAWVEDICDWVMDKITDTDRIVMGMNSYGYMATPSAWDIELLTKAQAATKTGYGGATLDAASNEMEWTNGGKYYCYVDSAGMDAKRQLIEDKGIRRISVWHLGGNDWFTSAKLEPEEVVTAPGYKVRVGGSFVDATRMVKVAGSFVEAN